MFKTTYMIHTSQKNRLQYAKTFSELRVTSADTTLLNKEIFTI